MTTPNIRELRRQRASQNERSPKWLRLGLWCAALYVVYVLAGFFIAPSVIKSQLERRASAQLNRTVTVDRVAFNPLTLSLRLEKLLVREAEAEPEIGWSSLFVNYQLWSLVGSEIHFSEIVLDGFASRLHVSKDGILNVADMLRTDRAEEEPGKQWTLRIDRLSVNRAEIDYTDESRAEPFKTHVGPTTFVLREFRTSGSSGAPGVFTAATEAGEDISWSGRIALAPLRSNGELRIGKLELKKYAPFYSPLVNFDVLQGALDLRLPYEFFLENEKPQLKLTEASVKIQGLHLAERGKADAVIELSQIDVGPTAADLQARSVTVRQVLLTGGRVVALRNEQGLNLTRFAPPSSASAATPPSAASPPEASWTVRIGEVATKELTLVFEDMTTPLPASLQLANATLSLKKFSLGEKAAALPLTFDAQLSPAGGTMKVEGDVALQPLSATLNYTLDGIGLAPLSPWAESFVDVHVKNGSFNARGRIGVSMTPDGELVLKAGTDAQVTGLEVTDGFDAPLARVGSLAISQADYTSSPARFAVSEIALVNPEVDVLKRADGTLNVATILRETSPGAAPAPTVKSPVGAPSPGETPPLFIALDRISVTNAALRFTDRTVEPEVKTGVQELSGTITGATSAAIDRADVKFSGRLIGGAPLAITGTANVLGGAPNFDLKLDTKGSDLASIAPYVGKYVGYQLSSGALSLDARAKVADQKLDSLAKVVVTNLNLGAATQSPDAPNVPIHLALALLRDREGKIVLDLPVQGSLNDPSFQIGSVVTRVIGNLITKAATSPFSLIGSMFGGGRSGEDLQFQDFAPGSAQLDAQDTEKLEIVARAMRERPALRLAISGAYDAAKDAAELRQVELERRIRTAIWEDMRQINPDLKSPDEVTVSREGASRVIAEFYREAFVKPFEQVIAAPAENEEPEKERRRFFLFRWFTRDRPEPKPETAAKVPAVSAPKPLPNESEMRARLIEAVPIGDAELKALAQARAETVRRHMIENGQVDPARLEVAEPAPAVLTSGARVTLQLK